MLSDKVWFCSMKEMNSGKNSGSSSEGAEMLQNRPRAERRAATREDRRAVAGPASIILPGDPNPQPELLG